MPPAPIRPMPIRSLAPRTARASGPAEASMPTAAPARVLLKFLRVISESAIYLLPPISFCGRPQRNVRWRPVRFSRFMIYQVKEKIIDAVVTEGRAHIGHREE